MSRIMLLHNTFPKYYVYISIKMLQVYHICLQCSFYANKKYKGYKNEFIILMMKQYVVPKQLSLSYSYTVQAEINKRHFDFVLLLQIQLLLLQILVSDTFFSTPLSLLYCCFNCRNELLSFPINKLALSTLQLQSLTTSVCTEAGNLTLIPAPPQKKKLNIYIYNVQDIHTECIFYPNITTKTQNYFF